jgi:hypothetical protein
MEKNHQHQTKNRPVFWKQAQLEKLDMGSHTISITDVYNISEKWKNSSAEEKQQQAEGWGQIFKWAVQVARTYNLSMGKLFGPKKEDSCTKCFGTGFFIMWNKEPHTTEVKCPRCGGYGHYVSVCHSCSGTGKKEGVECHTCKGSGIYHYFNKPCIDCGSVTPSGNIIVGSGKLVKIIRGYKITECRQRGGWGSLDPHKHLGLANFNEGGEFENHPRINKE